MGVPRFRRRRGPRLSAFHPADERRGDRARRGGGQGRGRSLPQRRRRRRRSAPASPSPPTAAPRAFARRRGCRSATSARRWTSSGSGCRRSAEPDNETTGVVRLRPDHGADRPRRLLAMRLCLPQGHGGGGARPRHRGVPRRGRGDRADAARRGSGRWRTGTTSSCSPSRSTGSSSGTGPGLLVIGDAAHAMSPVGGVGINVAVQDAVAAANVLAGPMAAGEDVDPLLAQGREAPPAGGAHHPGLPARGAAADHQPAADARSAAPSSRPARCAGSTAIRCSGASPPP